MKSIQNIFRINLLLIFGASVTFWNYSAFIEKTSDASMEQNVEITSGDVVEDTVIVSELSMIIRNGPTKRRAIFQNGLGYIDKNGKIRKREKFKKANKPVFRRGREYKFVANNNASIYLTADGKRLRAESPVGNYVEYFLLNVSGLLPVLQGDGSILASTGSLSIEYKSFANGVKENIVLHDKYAQTSFQFFVSSDLPLIVAPGVIQFGEKIISKLYAYDSANREIPLSINLNVDTLTISVDVDSALFPVTIDPSAQWISNLGLIKDAHIQNDMYNNVYNSDYMYLIASTAKDTRILMQFDSLDIIPTNAINIRASLILTAINTDPTAIGNYASVYRLDSSWVESDVSWRKKATGIYWDDEGGTYSDFISTRQMVPQVVGDTVIFDLSNGVENWVSGAWENNGFVIRNDSEEEADAINTHFGTSERGDSQPQLIIDYDIPDPIGPPFDLNITDHQYNSISVAVKDTGKLGSIQLVFFDSLKGLFGDTIDISGGDSVIADTFSYNSYFDSLFVMTALSIDTSGQVRYSNKDTIRSFAEIVPAIVVSDTSDSSIQLAFQPDNNPPRVGYRFFDIGTNQFVDTSGAQSSDSSWYPSSSFDTLNILTGVNTFHSFFIDAINSDSAVSTHQDTTSLWSFAQIPSIDSLFAHAPDSVFIRMDPVNNPSYTYFALEDSISGDLYNLDSLRFESMAFSIDSLWAWYRFDEWGGVIGRYIVVPKGRTYNLRMYAKDGNVR